MFAAIRGVRLRHLAVVAVLALPLGVFFAPTFIAGNAPGGFDLNFQSSPWRDAPTRPIDPQSRVQIDQAEQLPWVDAVWSSLRGGRAPLWSAAVGGGTSVGTNPVFATYSVFTVVGELVAGVAGQALGLAVRVILSVAVGELFAYLFFRRMRLSIGASLFGTVAYVFSGAVVAFEVRNAIPLLLPLALWCTDRLAERASPERIVALAAAVLALWLEGFPAMMVHVLVVSGTWWIVRTAARTGWRWRDAGVRRDWLRSAGAYASAAVLGGVLSAFSTVPFALQLGYNDVFAVRHDAIEPLGHASIWWLLDERALGPPDLGPWYTGLNPIEGLAAVGTLVMLLAVIGVVGGSLRRRAATDAAASDAASSEDASLEDVVRNYWAVMVGVLVVAIYLGGPLLRVLASLPGFSGNPFSRIRFVAVFGLVVLGALGFQRVEGWWRARTAESDPLPSWSQQLRARWPHVTIAALFLVGLVTPFVTSLRLFVHVTRVATGSFGIWGSELGLLAVALIVGGVGLRLTQRLPERWVPWRTIGLGAFAAAVAFTQVGLQITRLTPQVDRQFYSPSTPGYQALREATGTSWRFIGSGMGTFAPNSAMNNGVIDARSHSFRDPQWKKLILAVFPNALAADPLKINVDFSNNVNWGSPVFDDMSLGVIALSSDEVPLGTRGVVPPADAWTDIGKDGSFVSEGPTGPYVGVDLRLRTTGDCSEGDVVVTAQRDGGVAQVSRRPIRDARVAAAAHETTPFAVPMDDGAPDAPSRLQVSLEGAAGGCRVGIGRVGDVAASAPFTRPVDATWRMISAVGGWLYSRPSAHPLVRMVATWSSYRSSASALAAATDPARSSAGPMPISGAVRPGSGTTDGTVERWSADGHGLSVTTMSAGPSMVVASFNAAPGWTVTIDGVAATMVQPDGALLGVAVPHGRHKVRFEYLPPGLRVGALLSVVGVLACTALLLVPWRRRRRSARPSGIGVVNTPNGDAPSGG